MITKRQHLYTLLLPFLLISTCWGVTQTDSKQWSVFTLTGNYGRFVYLVEPQLRLIDGERPFNQFLINGGGGYKLPHQFELWLGQTISTVAQDVVAGSREEYRVWEQIVWNYSFLKSNLISRSRFEQRRSLYYPEVAYRFRERIYLNIPIASNLAGVIFDELFIKLNNVPWVSTSTLDQNRLYLGVEQTLSETSFFGVGYMLQYLSTTPQQADNVLMLTYRINLKT